MITAGEITLGLKKSLISWLDQRTIVCPYESPVQAPTSIVCKIRKGAACILNEILRYTTSCTDEIKNSPWISIPVAAKHREALFCTGSIVQLHLAQIS